MMHEHLGGKDDFQARSRSQCIMSLVDMIKLQIWCYAESRCSVSQEDVDQKC